MFRKVLLLSAVLAIGASVGSVTPANASLSLETRSNEIHAKAEPVGIKAAQHTPATATDATPAKPAPVVSSTSTSPTAPTVRRAAAPKRVVASTVTYSSPRSYSFIHGVTY